LQTIFNLQAHLSRNDDTTPSLRDIRIKTKEELENDIVFFYQLRFADRERRHEAGFRGAYLERFVYMTMIDNTVMFSVHVPTPGEYFFEVFGKQNEQKAVLRTPPL
jgi:hypothetical protein